MFDISPSILSQTFNRINHSLLYNISYSTDIDINILSRWRRGLPIRNSSYNNVLFVHDLAVNNCVTQCFSDSEIYPLKGSIQNRVKCNFFCSSTSSRNRVHCDKLPYLLWLPIAIVNNIDVQLMLVIYNGRCIQKKQLLLYNIKQSFLYYTNI